MPIIRFFQCKRALSFGFSELCNIQLNHYNLLVDVGEQPHHIAKKQDYHPNKGRQHRRIAGGNAKFVESTYDGLKSGMRGLQDGANRNKRVVSFWTMIVPGKFCPISKPKEYETMNADTAMGNHAQKPHAQPLRLIPAQAPCNLTLADVFESLEDLYTLTDSLWSLAQVHPAASPNIRTLATNVTRGVDSLRFRVFDAMQGGAA